MKKRKILEKLFCLLVLFLLLSPSSFSFAASKTGSGLPAEGGVTTPSSSSGLPAEGTPPASGGASSNTHFLNPLGDTSTFEGLVKNVAGIAARVGLTIAVIYIIYAGLMFVLARGKPAELEKAKKNLLYVVIGTGILLGAWVIADVIYATIQKLGS